MTKILFPVGRMVGGSLYKSQPRTDNLGKPKLAADGSPLTAFNFGVALEKKGEAHWSQTPWGAQIKQIGEAAFGEQTKAPSFAWKIVDGDSTIPNKKNKRPVDQEGYPGHWVLWYSQGWAPKICNADGSRELTEPDSIVPGYFMQVYAAVTDNGAKNPSPGVYLNPEAVALAGYGPRIEGQGVDTTSVGFGGGAAPAGMSSTPVGTMSAPSPTNSAPPAPGALPKPPTPNAAFLAPPPKMLTPAGVAAGGTYDDFVKAGWNDQQMKDAGYLA